MSFIVHEGPHLDLETQLPLINDPNMTLLLKIWHLQHLKQKTCEINLPIMQLISNKHASHGHNSTKVFLRGSHIFSLSFFSFFSHEPPLSWSLHNHVSLILLDVCIKLSPIHPHQENDPFNLSFLLII